MHDKSQPTSDRFDHAEVSGPTAAAEDRLGRRPAIVLRLRDGSFFRAWRSRGGFFRVSTMRRAKLFVPGGEALRRTVAKLERKGVTADALMVEIAIEFLGR